MGLLGDQFTLDLTALPTFALRLDTSRRQSPTRYLQPLSRQTSWVAGNSTTIARHGQSSRRCHVGQQLKRFCSETIPVSSNYQSVGFVRERYKPLTPSVAGCSKILLTPRWFDGVMTVTVSSYLRWDPGSVKIPYGGGTDPVARMRNLPSPFCQSTSSTAILPALYDN